MGGFKWPELTHDLDCAGIGYPGVVVTLVLNPEPLPEDQEFGGKPWDTAWYHRLARVFKRIAVPGQYRDDGEDWQATFDGPESIWNLDGARDFDSRILLYAMSEFSRLRIQEIQAARKN